MNTKKQDKTIREVGEKIPDSTKRSVVKIVFAVISASIVIPGVDEIVSFGTPDYIALPLFVVGFIVFYHGLESIFFGNDQPWIHRLSVSSILRGVIIVLVTGLLAFLGLITVYDKVILPITYFSGLGSFVPLLDIGLEEIGFGVFLLLGYWAASKGLDKLESRVSGWTT